MSLHRPLIAVVDDETPIRVALRRLLHSAGFLVETFECGSDFLDSLSTRQPDCVVLDLHMPRGNGFAVQAGLAEKSLRVPVVVITGHDDAHSNERALIGGAAAYLRKPVDDQALLKAIATAMGSSAPKERGGDQP